MAERNADAVWKGSLKEGKGRVRFGGGAFEGEYTWSSRFENGAGTNPEELLAAAHAACFSMALSSNLGKAGFIPDEIHTTARVKIELVEEKHRITHIQLETEAKVPGIDNVKFQEIAETVGHSCPVSVALASVPIEVVAKLI